MSTIKVLKELGVFDLKLIMLSLTNLSVGVLNAFRGILMLSCESVTFNINPYNLIVGFLLSVVCLSLVCYLKKKAVVLNTVELNIILGTMRILVLSLILLFFGYSMLGYIFTLALLIYNLLKYRKSIKN